MLGIDYGRARTGFALSDPLGVTCRPLRVLAERDMDKVIEAIVSAVKGYDAEGVVVGLPRPLAGGTNEQLEHVLEFVTRLRQDSPVPVQTWDERFTSSLAQKGSSGKEHRDSVAACYMLQNYLDKLTVENRG